MSLDCPVSAVSPEAIADELVGVIMAGGAGTRFWPASTGERPKQFLTLFGERSMLQQAYDRLRGLLPRERILVFTAAEFVPIVAAQLVELPRENIIGEPMRRDTAAAMTLAATLCAQRFGDPVIAVLTSDHLVTPVERFEVDLISAARAAAAGDALYTFGIPPTAASTAFGYLELGERRDSGDELRHFDLKRFVEKPDQDTAQQYVDGGKHLWNSGMFVWRASTVLAEIDRQLPAHAEALRRAVLSDGTPEFKQDLHDAFEGLDKISMDFGVMENAKKVRCVEAQFSWSDLGGFPALAEHLPIDSQGNTTRGRFFGFDAQDNLVFSENEEDVVAIVGASNLVVVRAGNRTLVVPRDRAEDIKKLVDMLDEDVR